MPDMTGPERAELTAFRNEMREELAQIRDDMASMKNEMAEWRGAKNLVKAVAATIGFGGVVYIVIALGQYAAAHPVLP